MGHPNVAPPGERGPHNGEPMGAPLLYSDLRGEPCPQVLECAFLHSAHMERGADALEGAILAEARRAKALDALRCDFHRVGSVPYDTTRGRASVVVAHRNSDDEHILTCLGTVDGVLAVCARAVDAGELVPLMPELRRRVLALGGLLSDWPAHAAVAYRVGPARALPYTGEDERDLTLLGLVAVGRETHPSRAGRP